MRKRWPVLAAVAVWTILSPPAENVNRHRVHHVVAAYASQDDLSAAVVARTLRMRTHTPNVHVRVPGVRLAFSVSRPAANGEYDPSGMGTELWITQYGQRRPERLLPNGDPACPRHIRKPRFSPDGKRILFVAPAPGHGPGDPREGPSATWVMEVSTRACRFVAPYQGTERLAWLPDNRRYVAEDGLPYGRLQVVDTRTGSARRLPNPKGEGYDSAWDLMPDGSAIIYVELRHSHLDVYAEPLDGFRPRRLCRIRTADRQDDDGALNTLAVSPDGLRFALAGTGLVIATLDGRVLRRREDCYDDISWSPNGRYLAVYSEGRSTDTDGMPVVGFGWCDIGVMDIRRNTVKPCFHGGSAVDYKGPILMGTLPAANAFVAGWQAGGQFLWWPASGSARQTELFGPDGAGDAGWWSPLVSQR